MWYMKPLNHINCLRERALGENQPVHRVLRKSIVIHIGGIMSRKPVITIDGPAGAGKSTVSRLLAQRLSFVNLDTGALYRAIAYRLSQKGWDGDPQDLSVICSGMKIVLKEGNGRFLIYVDNENVTEKIRTEEIASLASRISAVPLVRELLLSVQQETAVRGGVVAEGRDMGTVVFPEAEIKFFLDATVNERASRRAVELQSKGNGPSLTEVKETIMSRDKQDRERTIAPLTVAQDAIIVDSTNKTVSEVVDFMLQAIEQLYRP